MRCEKVSPEAWAVTRRLDPYLRKEGIYPLPLFRNLNIFVDVLVLGVTAGLLTIKDNCEYKPNRLKMKDQNDEKGAHLCDLWNFLLLYFLLDVIVNLWYAQKCRSWSTGLILSLLEDTISETTSEGQERRAKKGKGPAWESIIKLATLRRVNSENHENCILGQCIWGGRGEQFIYQHSSPIDQRFACGMLIALNFWVLHEWAQAQIPQYPTAWC